MSIVHIIARLITSATFSLALALGGCDAEQPLAAQAAPAHSTTAPQQHGQPAATALAAQTVPWNYLRADSIDLDKLIPQPPDASSPAARAFEDQLTSEVKELATPAAKSRADADENDSVWRFAPAMGPGFTREQCPRIAALLTKAEQDVNRLKNAKKDEIRRQRPSAADIGKQASQPTDFSYPSGHATRAAMRARLLAAIAPEREEDLWGQAWYMCMNRVVRGVHFPSDVAAGFILGETAATQMLAGTAMAADLAAAKEEWAAVSARP